MKSFACIVQMLSGLQYNGGPISYQLTNSMTLNSDGSLHPQAQILLAALAAQVRGCTLCGHSNLANAHSGSG